MLSARSAAPGTTPVSYTHLGAPLIMGAPNLCVDTPAMWDFSKKMNVPIAGKDFKSGQTLMKTVLAPMFKTRMPVSYTHLYQHVDFRIIAYP